MSHFRKLSHAVWHCQYHLVWTPKYHFRMLTGEVGTEVARCIRAFSEYLKGEVVAL
jgi:putative transposase